MEQVFASPSAGASIGVGTFILNKLESFLTVSSWIVQVKGDMLAHFFLIGSHPPRPRLPETQVRGPFANGC
jgi:hypothetical protein